MLFQCPSTALCPRLGQRLVLPGRELENTASQHKDATATSSKAAELEAARLRAELDQAGATLRAKEAELAAVQNKLAAAESAAARAAAAPPATPAAPGMPLLLLSCSAVSLLERHAGECTGTSSACAAQAGHCN